MSIISAHKAVAFHAAPLSHFSVSIKLMPGTDREPWTQPWPRLVVSVSCIIADAKWPMAHEIVMQSDKHGEFTYTVAPGHSYSARATRDNRRSLTHADVRVPATLIDRMLDAISDEDHARIAVAAAENRIALRDWTATL